MKKIILWISLWAITTVLIWCGWSKKWLEKVDRIEQLWNPTVTTGDAQQFKSIVWGIWYASGNTEDTLFFRWDNSFIVTTWDQEAFGPWVISKWKILLWEENLELEIIWDNEISISNKVYKREVIEN